MSLLERAFDGDLDEAEERALADRLKADPAAARRFLELARDEALLGEVATEARLLRPAAPRWTAVALAAGMLLAVVGVILAPRRGPAARIIEVTGDVRLNQRPARAGDLLYPDGRLSTGQGNAVVEYGDGRRVRLLPNGVLTKRSDYISVRRGVVEVEGTPALRAEEDARILVRRGTATVNGLSVPAGHFASARPGRPFAADPIDGAGLRGEYFDGPDLTGLRFSRVDPAVDVADFTPALSARWSGRLVPRETGAWTFHVDGRLWVDGRPASEPLHLDAWRPVDIRLECDRPAAVRLEWSGPGTPRQVVPTSVLHPAPAGGGGLSAEYFDGLDFQGARIVGVDPVIEFNWGLGSPHPSMGTDDFSVRWTGFLEPDRTGIHTFTTVSDDGVRLWVDGRLIIDDWAVRGSKERSGTIVLTADRRVPIRLEYFDRVSTAHVFLYWQTPGRPRDLIPRRALFPR